MDENILAKRISMLRKEKNLNQLELSKILNISNTTLSQYETGKRVPSDEIKNQIADYFDVTVDFLLGRSDIRNPYKNCNKSRNLKTAAYKNIDVADLPEEAVKQVEEYVEFIKQKHENKKE